MNVVFVVEQDLYMNVDVMICQMVIVIVMAMLMIVLVYVVVMN